MENKTITVPNPVPNPVPGDVPGDVLVQDGQRETGPGQEAAPGFPVFDPVEAWRSVPPALKDQLGALFLAEFIGSSIAAGLSDRLLDEYEHGQAASAAHQAILVRVQSCPEILRLISEAALPDISGLKPRSLRPRTLNSGGQG